MEPWAPTSADVHALIPQRANGEPFGADTVPTEAQVSVLIGLVTTEILGDVGPIPDQLHEDAKAAASLGAAYYVEAGLFPEQQQDSLAPAGRLHTRYREQVARLASRIGQLADRATAGTLYTPPARRDPPLYPCDGGDLAERW